ncbi:MAG: RNA recognition motif domain-containing protein [Planctomycetota bacterium]
MNIYVGNVPFSSTEDNLRQLFETFGQVSSVKLITDRETGRPRGFGFVEMVNDEEGRKAIEGTDGKEHNGRMLKVNEARPKENRGPGGGGGGGGGMGRDRGPRPPRRDSW